MKPTPMGSQELIDHCFGDVDTNEVRRHIIRSDDTCHRCLRVVGYIHAIKGRLLTGWKQKATFYVPIFSTIITCEECLPFYLGKNTEAVEKARGKDRVLLPFQVVHRGSSNHSLIPQREHISSEITINPYDDVPDFKAARYWAHSGKNLARTLTYLEYRRGRVPKATTTIRGPAVEREKAFLAWVEEETRG
jgi:hypothetical protein